MAKITEMSAQKRNKRRVNIYLDGEFALSLEAVTALSAGLRTGGETTREALLALKKDSDAEAAFARAADYISRRMRTEKELRTYLAGKDYPPEAADAAIAKLKEYGYVDDAGFVQTYMETYASRRGKKRLARDLGMRGADRRLIEEAVAGLGDQREAAVAAAEKYLRTRAFDARKLSAHLASMGFEWEDIEHAVRVCGGKEEE